MDIPRSFCQIYLIAHATSAFKPAAQLTPQKKFQRGIFIVQRTAAFEKIFSIHGKLKRCLKIKYQECRASKLKKTSKERQAFLRGSSLNIILFVFLSLKAKVAVQFFTVGQ